MRILIINILLILFLPETRAQSIISGTVRDKRDNPLTGANIYFENTYEGCTSDREGNFVINTDLKENQKLIVSYIGFKDFEHREISLLFLGSKSYLRDHLGRYPVSLQPGH